MPAGEPDEARRLFLAIGAEIRQARGKRTAQSLADAIGKDQTSISNYERGGTIPLPVLWEIEAELGLRRSELLVRARAVAPEIVPVNTPAQQAIQDDPDLDGPGKEAVLYAYRYCVSVSKPDDGASNVTFFAEALDIEPNPDDATEMLIWESPSFTDEFKRAAIQGLRAQHTSQTSEEEQRGDERGA